MVRRPDGAIVLDPGGRQNGRGAYLCADPACWEAGIARGGLARALGPLPDDLRRTLAAGPDGLAATTIESPRTPTGPHDTTTDTIEGGTRGQE